MLSSLARGICEKHSDGVVTELSRMVRRKLETLALGPCIHALSHGKSVWFGSGLQRRSTDPRPRLRRPALSRFPSDTLLPAVVEAVMQDIKPAAQIVWDIVREGGARHPGDEA